MTYFIIRALNGQLEFGCYEGGEGLSGFPEKARGGLHDAGSKLFALAFGILGSEVFEVRYTERATQRIEMKIDVLTPFVVERTQQKRTDCAPFGAAKPLQFPGIRQEILEFFGRRGDGEAGFLDAFVNVFEAAVFDECDGFLPQSEDFSHILVGKLAVE